MAGGKKRKKKKAEPEPEVWAGPPGLGAVWRGRFRKLVMVAAVLVVAGWLLLPPIGAFLVQADELQPAEVLVVLSGDRGERMEYAYSLYEQGLAGLFILSGGPLYADLSEADLLRRHAVILGVPEGKIIMETKAANTYQNAVYTRKLMELYGLESAIVVSSPYHMRRVRLLFEEAYAGSGIKLAYAPVEKSWFEPERWWTSSAGWRLVGTEYVKLAFQALPERWRHSYYRTREPRRDGG